MLARDTANFNGSLLFPVLGAAVGKKRQEMIKIIYGKQNTAETSVEYVTFITGPPLFAAVRCGTRCELHKQHIGKSEHKTEGIESIEQLRASLHRLRPFTVRVQLSLDQAATHLYRPLDFIDGGRRAKEED
ncbi:hypothetical protein CBL_08221 [Carabus blaptoides fortunei]